ncbi:MAG TPA: hypothetical protein VFT45_12770 [Longimicrobium sp.]|nr:hypothetical protein [Longimicrobium sp.]
MRIFRHVPALAALLSAAACIPYATGTTALTTPRGEMEPSASVYFIPGGLERLTVDSVGGSYFGIDSEMRMGLDDRSDLGIRAAGWMGLVLNYKHRIDGRPGAEGPALSYMVGTGVVNAGEHAYLEASLLASGRPGGGEAGATPYGGIKTMYVLPLTDEAVSDDPSVGAFAGLRIGTEAFAISPEIAVFYDRSALDVRDSDWIIVPSFTFHGDELMRRIFGSRPGSGTPRPGYPRPWP